MGFLVANASRTIECMLPPLDADEKSLEKRVLRIDSVLRADFPAGLVNGHYIKGFIEKHAGNRQGAQQLAKSGRPNVSSDIETSRVGYVLSKQIGKVTGLCGRVCL